MSTSINTNQAALTALETLNATSASLAQVQNRVSTGLKVSSAKDNGAIWAIAETQRAQNSSLDAVRDSLNNGKSVLDTTVSAGSQLTDLLTQLQSKALAASDVGISDDSRAQYQNEFQKLAQTYANVIASATFNGRNLVDGSTGALSSLGSADGKITVTSAHDDISAATLFAGVGSLAVTQGAAGATASDPRAVDTVAAGAGGWTGANGAANAKADLAQLDTALTTVTSALSGFGVDSKAFDNQLTLVSNLQDALTTGVGNLVDADVAKESANLTALQTKQQLGVQALSIANSAPQIILSLFKS